MKKTVSFITIILLGVIFPIVTHAQYGKSELFFRADNEDIYDNRDLSLSLNINSGTGNDPFGAPVGSGLLVLTIAGVGYAIVSRKRANKGSLHVSKSAILFMALALTLSLTQCKKRIETNTFDSDNSVHFTLNVGNDNRYINPNENGFVPVRYLLNDKIYVGNGSKYIGTLTCIVASDENGKHASFEGDIAAPSDGTALHFYYISGLTPNVTPEIGATEEFTVDISDQSSSLPVLSHGMVEYYGETSLSCTLHNQCALVELVFANKPTDLSGNNAKVSISNMYTEAKIDFANPGITRTEKLDAIALYPQPDDATFTKKWAILMYNDKVLNSMGMVYKETVNYGYTSSVNNMIDIYDYYDGVEIPQLSSTNNYIYGSEAISVNNTPGNDVSNTVFVVSANGNAVRFAPANLICRKTGATWADGYEWSFADHPYDVFVKQNSVVGLNHADVDVIDHFGWGCTGFQDALYGASQAKYEPYCTENPAEEYGPGGAHNLSIINKSDWGYVANQANLGGHDDWRLLTKDEWTYLVYTRNHAWDEAATIQVKGVTILGVTNQNLNAFMLFPEKWENPSNLKIACNPWSNNTVNGFVELQALLDNNPGVLFLPALGVRQTYTTASPGLNQTIRSYNSTSSYWISDNNGAAGAYYTTFNGSGSRGTSTTNRALGYPVRLVR